jgi:hypothetical protein
MDEWEIQQQAAHYKIWVTAQLFQRPEHIASKCGMGRHPHMWNKIHVCTGKVWDSIPTGCTAFFEVYQEIKKFERLYPDQAVYYSIILKSLKGAPTKNYGYIFGCRIHYNTWSGEVKLSKCCRSIPVFTLMLNTARQYGGVIEVEPPTNEQRLSEVRKRMLRRRVLNI